MDKTLKDFYDRVIRGELKEPELTFHSMIKCLNVTIKDAVGFNRHPASKGFTNYTRRIKLLIGYIHDYTDEYGIEIPDSIKDIYNAFEQHGMSDEALDLLSRSDPERLDPLLIKMQLDNDIDMNRKMIELSREFFMLNYHIKSSPSLNPNYLISKTKEMELKTKVIREQMLISPYSDKQSEILIREIESFISEIYSTFK